MRMKLATRTFLGRPMTESVENLVLEQLRLIRADQAGMRADVREVKQRLATLEAG